MKIEVKNIFLKNRIANLNFTLHSGDRIALIGTNGSGKSTLLKIMMGILSPDSGIVNVSNAEFGAVFQENLLDDSLSILQNLKFRSFRKDQLEYAKQLLTLFRVRDFGQQYGSLSGGQKRIISLVRALMLNPNVFILDELSVGMDVDIRGEAWNQINLLLNPNNGLIYTTHDLSELQYANKVLFLQDGQQKYFGSMDKFVSQMSKFKLIIYADKRSTPIKKYTDCFFDSSADVLEYLTRHKELSKKNFEVRQTSFDDLFINTERDKIEN